MTKGLMTKSERITNHEALIGHSRLRLLSLFVIRHSSFSWRTCHGFTLIEIMVVCAIIGIIMTISVPVIYRQLHPESMQKAVSDVLEACKEARAHAVLSGTTHELVLRPADKQIDVVAGTTRRPSDPQQPDRLESLNVAGEEWRMEDRAAAASTGSSIFTARLSDKIVIQGVGLNGLDWSEDEVVRVRFYANGTADEFQIVLGNDQNEQRMVYTDVVTGLADVETEAQLQKYLR